MHSSSERCTIKDKHDDNIQHNSNKGSPLLLFICASGICGCYLYFGMIQEKLFSKGSAIQESGVGNVTTFMLVLSCLTNVIVSFLWTWIQEKMLARGDVLKDTLVKGHGQRKSAATRGSQQQLQHHRPLNHAMLLANAFTYFAAMTASNEALGYVSYPTAVLAKSSKLIPTMIVGSWVEQKTFKVQEWCSALLITGGIVIFNLSRLSKRNHHLIDDKDSDSPFGIFLLILSLAMDGLLASCQDSLKQTKKGKYRIPSALESMLWVNAYAILFMLPLSIYNGQFVNGCKLLAMGLPNSKHSMTKKSPISSFWRKIPIQATKRWLFKIFRGGKTLETHPVRHSNMTMPHSLPWAIVLLNLTAAAGQIFIFFTIALFSPLTCTTITTTRKFFTILLSVWKFGHVVTSIQWMAIGMVFAGLYLAILSKFTTSVRTGISVSGRKEKGD